MAYIEDLGFNEGGEAQERFFRVSGGGQGESPWTGAGAERQAAVWSKTESRELSRTISSKVDYSSRARNLLFHVLRSLPSPSRLTFPTLL